MSEHKKTNVSELEERIDELEQKLEDALETEKENNFTETDDALLHTKSSNVVNINIPKLNDLEENQKRTSRLLTKFLSLVHPEIAAQLELALQLDAAIYSPEIPFGAYAKDILNEKRRLLEQEIRDMARHLQRKPKKGFTPNLFEEKGADL